VRREHHPSASRAILLPLSHRKGWNVCKCIVFNIYIFAMKNRAQQQNRARAGPTGSTCLIRPSSNAIPLSETQIRDGLRKLKTNDSSQAKISRRRIFQRRRHWRHLPRDEDTKDNPAVFLMKLRRSEMHVPGPPIKRQAIPHFCFL